MTEAATVYVIDDDDAVRHSLLFLLDVHGLRGQGFDSAGSFLASPPRTTSGCIVTDMRMPRMDGAELMRLLPAHGVNLPVIVITGHGDAGAAAKVMAAGVFDFIEKPFQDAAILDAVRAALTIGKPDPARDARAQMTIERIALLPERERRLLDRLMRGETDPDPSDASASRAENELLRARIMRRLGATTVPHLMRLVTEARRRLGQAGASL